MHPGLASPPSDPGVSQPAGGGLDEGSNVALLRSIARLMEETNMAVRLVVTINAAPGKGAELAQAFRSRCAEVAQEPGCQQFEVFQSQLDPDKLVLLELWADADALAQHAKVNATRAPRHRPT